MRLIDADALQEPVVKLLELAIKRVEYTPNDSPCYRMYVAQENERSRFIDLIDNAPTVVVRPIRCKECKYQKKYWHEDKRFKNNGYWVYGCDLVDDPYVGTPVCGQDNQFCSSAKLKGGAE